MPTANFEIKDENKNDAPLLSELAAEAFGPGRFARTAYRIREGIAPVSSLSLAAWLEGRLVGGIRFTALTIGAEGDTLLLGPLVVHPAHKGKGYGQALASEGLARARTQGFRLVVLVGDMPYYGRFGFTTIPPGQVTLPGPVDPKRLLALELVRGALAGAAGLVQAKVRSPSARAD
jgi:predicted N-acetyltransferase YhbS